jgi:hypothetical protein
MILFGNPADLLHGVCLEPAQNIGGDTDSRAKHHEQGADVEEDGDTVPSPVRVDFITLLSGVSKCVHHTADRPGSTSDSVGDLFGHNKTKNSDNYLN